MHEVTQNGQPPFRPTLSAIGTPTYKVAKFLLAFLTPLTQNEFTITDTFHFVEEKCKQDPNLYMASLDVDSLFTNIPLDKTIDICINSLYKDNEKTPKIPKDVLRNFRNVATRELFFMFSNYKQIDGVAMGCPLGPAPANIFMGSFEIKWLKDCPHTLKPVFYRRYVDDIFVFFPFPDYAETFKKYLSSKQPNINFSLEKENVIFFFICFRHQYIS